MMRGRRSWIAGSLLLVAVSGCGGTSLYAPTPVMTLSGSTIPSSMGGTTYLEPAERGEPLALSGSDLEGTPLDLASYRGSVVLLNSWATWCVSCQEEEPVLRAAHDSTKAAGVTFLGLDVQDDPARARELDLPWPSIVDRDGALLRTIPGVPPAALPSTVILDAQGRIAARIIGPVTDAAALTALLQKVARS